MAAGLAPGPVRDRTGARFAVAAAVATGAVLALQQRLNGDLRVAVGDAVLTALISFGSGLLLVGAVVAARPVSRRALPSLREAPRWSLLSGLGGAVLVAVSAAAAPRLGVAALTIAVVAGQTVGAAAVDRMGIGPGPARRLTGLRLAAGALCLAAVGISVGAPAAGDLVLLLAAVVAGVASALQQALVGRVRRSTGDAAVATLVNFAVGGGALALLLGLRVATTGLPTGHWPGPADAALYAGGVLGVAVVATTSVVVRSLGVLRLGLAVTAGQLVGAVLLDAGRSGVPTARLVAAGLVLVSVALAGRSR